MNNFASYKDVVYIIIIIICILKNNGICLCPNHPPEDVKLENFTILRVILGNFNFCKNCFF